MVAVESQTWMLSMAGNGFQKVIQEMVTNNTSKFVFSNLCHGQDVVHEKAGGVVDVVVCETQTSGFPKTVVCIMEGAEITTSDNISAVTRGENCESKNCNDGYYSFHCFKFLAKI